jgi:hypothetical protein
MIAPISPPPSPKRRRTALSAARHAVAEALFDADGRSRNLSKRRGWILIGLVLAAAVTYLVALLWCSLDG